MKSAGELQITDQEFKSLINVRNRLASGKIAWIGSAEKEWDRDLFNMGTICSVGACRTVACIGGWMAIDMGFDTRLEVADFVENEMSRALRPLCYPNPGLMDQVKPEDAVKAIDNFLNIGAPMWEFIMRRLHVEGYAEQMEAQERAMLTSQQGVVDLGSASESHSAELPDMHVRHYLIGGETLEHEPLAITHKEKVDAGE